MAMSFKCSVFGHAYGDSEIEREREEDGSEVVTTIRETQTCKRCGEMRVVSENKEVTTLETAADIVAEDLEEPEPEQPPAETEPREQTESAETETIIPDAETGEDITTAEPAQPETVESEPPEQTAETDPETDDGVILDEDEDESEPEREPGEWPKEPEDDGDDWKPEIDIDPTPDDDRRIEPTETAVTVPEGEFHCPECEFVTPVEESSLREGDFCPECHRGTLEHVPE